MKKVTVKVYGKLEPVEKFLEQIEKYFALMLPSKIIEHQEDDKVHVFVDLDPYTLKEEV